MAHPADFGLSSLHNGMSSFLKINLFLNTHPTCSVSLKNPNTTHKSLFQALPSTEPSLRQGNNVDLEIIMGQGDEDGYPTGSTNKRNVDLGITHVKMVLEARRMDRGKREMT